MSASPLPPLPTANKENEHPKIINTKKEAKAKKLAHDSIFPLKYNWNGFEIRRKSIAKKHVQCICKSTRRESDKCNASIYFDRDRKSGIVIFDSG